MPYVESVQGAATGVVWPGVGCSAWVLAPGLGGAQSPVRDAVRGTVGGDGRGAQNLPHSNDVVAGRRSPVPRQHEKVERVHVCCFVLLNQ